MSLFKKGIVWGMMLERYGKPLCHYCRCHLKRGNGASCKDPHYATIDHIVPRSKGGTNDLANLVYACLACNQRKANKRYLE